MWTLFGNAPCDAIPHGGSETRVRYETASVPYGSSCVSQTQTRTCDSSVWSEWDGDYAELSCSVEDASGCDAIPHGGSETRVRYALMSVPYGSSCGSQTQTRTCNNGVWSDWDGDYAELSCSVDGAAGCDAVPHGGTETRVRYQTASVPYGSSCVSQTQTRTCADGVWSAWGDGYAELSCSVDGAAGCDAMPHGGTETRVRYETASVPYGSSCAVQTQLRTCNNGAWSEWDGDYAELSCSVDGAAGCDAIPHGGSETRVRYETASVPYGSSCVSQTQTRTCTDGVWSEWGGSYAELSCSVEGAAGCDAMPHGGTETRVRYETASVPYGSSCVAQTQTRTCNNGVWSEWGGNYAELSCSVDGAAGCDAIPHGGTETRVRYESASVPYGSSCVSQTQTRTCNNGVWSEWGGIYTELSCSVEGAAGCNSRPHGGTETRVRYETASVPYGSSCVSQTQTRTCNNGVWSQWDGTYAYASCVVEASDAIVSCDTIELNAICEEFDETEYQAGDCAGAEGIGCPGDAVGRCDISAADDAYSYYIQHHYAPMTSDLSQTTCEQLYGSWSHP